MKPEQIKGVLEKILFQNSENHFTIGEISTEEGLGSAIIAGPLPNVQYGETLTVFGSWQNHPKYGRQFKVDRFESSLPANVYGIRKYLGSGLVPGIGRKMAERIVDKFGEKTFEIIESDSGRLKEVSGIGKERARRIKSAWDAERTTREIMIFLQSYGVTVRQCIKLVHQYGNQARTILEEDPYRVAREIDGIGFKTADQIALNLGIGNESPKRLAAALLHFIHVLEVEGHTAIPRDALLDKTREELQVESQGLEASLDQLLTEQALLPLEGTNLLQSPSIRHAEKKLAEALHNLLHSPSVLPPILTDKAIVWASEKSRLNFAEKQADALRMALDNKVSILTGGPGTGKTTILRALVAILKAKKISIQLAAPTGRASQRMADSCRHSASTLHRLLKIDPATGKFQANENSPLSASYIIVDEVSMLDTWLASALLRAIKSGAHLLLVGDYQQLPSVGPGNVLGNLIASDLVPTTRLDAVYRQAKRSPIIQFAHAMLQGEMHLPSALKQGDRRNPDHDLFFYPATTPEECLQVLSKLYQSPFRSKDITFDPLQDVQLLVPMHRGQAGVQNLNRVLQSQLNGDAPGVLFAGTLYQKGDKVLQTRNNYDLGLFNGDLGEISAVNAEAGTIAVRFNGQEIDLDRLQMTDIDLAYAMTIHKSQGSEFPVVIIPLLKQHFMMLQRNLVYTAITRARNQAILIGDPTAWAMAIRNTDQQTRSTGLPVHLNGSA